MTQFICFLLLQASKIKLIHRSFKSLKAFESHSKLAHLAVVGRDDVVVKRNAKSSSSLDDWEVLILWSLIGVHHTLCTLKFEAILSTILPFYYIFKMGVLFCTFLLPNTKIPEFLLFSVVVPSINVLHVKLNEWMKYVENDPFQIPLIIMDLIWPGIAYPVCQPEDLDMILNNEEKLDDVMKDSSLTEAVKMKALRIKQLKESSLSTLQTSTTSVSFDEATNLSKYSYEIENDDDRKDSPFSLKTTHRYLLDKEESKSLLEASNSEGIDDDDNSENDSLAEWFQQRECYHGHYQSHTYEKNSNVREQKVDKDDDGAVHSPSSTCSHGMNKNRILLQASPNYEVETASYEEANLLKKKKKKRGKTKRKSLGERLKKIVTGDSDVRLTDYLFDLSLPQTYCINGMDPDEVIVSSDSILQSDREEKAFKYDTNKDKKKRDCDNNTYTRTEKYFNKKEENIIEDAGYRNGHKIRRSKRLAAKKKLA